MIYFLLYVVNTAMVAILVGDKFTPVSMFVMLLLTIPGWVAVWFESNRNNGSLSKRNQLK